MASTGIGEFDRPCNTLEEGFRVYDNRRREANSSVNNCEDTTWINAEKDVHVRTSALLSKQKSQVRKWKLRMVLALSFVYGIPAAFAFAWKRELKSDFFFSLVSFRARHTKPTLFCTLLLLISSVCIVVLLSMLSGNEQPIYILRVFSFMCVFAFSKSIDRVFLCGRRRFRITKETDVVAAENTANSRLVGITKKMVNLWHSYFGVGGLYFYHRVATIEQLEIALQSTTLLRSLNEEDAVLVIATTLLLMINSFTAFFFHIRRHKGLLIGFDGTLDILYTVFNAIRVTQNGNAMDVLDALSLGAPVLSVVLALSSYAKYRLLGASDGERSDVPASSRSLKKPPSLAKQTHSGRLKKLFYIGSNPDTPRANRIYKYLLVSLLCTGLSCGVAAGFVFFKTLAMHMQCCREYPCAWRHAWPRIYFQSSLSGNITCGESFVSHMNLEDCRDKDIGKITFSAFLKLRELSLGKLEYFPRELFRLINYPNSSLNEGKVSVSRLPAHFDFSGFGVTHIPKVLMSLAKEKAHTIESLNASYNKLDTEAVVEFLNSFPCSSSSQSFCALRTVDLSHNRITQVPIKVIDDPAFSLLNNTYLHHNEIRELGNAVALLKLDETFAIDYSNNPIESVSLLSISFPNEKEVTVMRMLELLGGSDAKDLSHVKTLAFSRCNVVGGIPPELPSVFENLTSLSLIQNDYMNGTLPRELGALSQLEWLYVVNSGLTGTIPSELGLLKNIERIVFSNNSITGGIPSELGSLGKLRMLALCCNRLSNTTLPWQVKELVPHRKYLQYFLFFCLFFSM